MIHNVNLSIIAGASYKTWLAISCISITVFVFIYTTLRVIVKQLFVKQKIFKLLLERKVREIQRKNEALEKNNLIQKRLITIISHDLISPLKFIHLTSKNLVTAADITPELKQEMLEEISNTSKELELLATNIMHWIKYQNENRRLTKQEFDLNILANNIFDIFIGLAKQKRISFQNCVDEGLMINQYMEPLKIVLYNLILNAINFTEKGSVIITGSETPLSIKISVTDNGKGMTKEQIENITSELFVVSSATVDKRKGNGLGYLIIKDMLKLVNARFEIESKKNVGTSVTIILPK
jgi:signal transduction histidine kinase